VVPDIANAETPEGALREGDRRKWSTVLPQVGQKLSDESTKDAKPKERKREEKRGAQKGQKYGAEWRFAGREGCQRTLDGKGSCREKENKDRMTEFKGIKWDLQGKRLVRNSK